MTSQTITTKYSLGDICYYIIHPTADIIQGVVLAVRIEPEADGVEIFNTNSLSF